jgi:hypothetical protein
LGNVLLDRLDALLGTRLGVIALAGGDDLAVGCLEVEAKLAGFVFADLELGCRGSSPRSFPRTAETLPLNGVSLAHGHCGS